MKELKDNIFCRLCFSKFVENTAVVQTGEIVHHSDLSECVKNLIVGWTKTVNELNQIKVEQNFLLKEYDNAQDFCMQLEADLKAAKIDAAKGWAMVGDKKDSEMIRTAQISFKNQCSFAKNQDQICYGKLTLVEPRADFFLCEGHRHDGFYTPKDNKETIH